MHARRKEYLRLDDLAHKQNKDHNKNRGNSLIAAFSATGIPVWVVPAGRFGYNFKARLEMDIETIQSLTFFVSVIKRLILGFCVFMVNVKPKIGHLRA